MGSFHDNHTEFSMLLQFNTDIGSFLSVNKYPDINLPFLLEKSPSYILSAF